MATYSTQCDSNFLEIGATDFDFSLRAYLLSVTLSNAGQQLAKVSWSNEVLDGCSKNSVVLKTKE